MVRRRLLLLSLDPGIEFLRCYLYIKLRGHPFWPIGSPAQMNPSYGGKGFSQCRVLPGSHPGSYWLLFDPTIDP